MARFAEINRWQFALNLGRWDFAQKDGGKASGRGRHKCLAQLTARESPTALKQCAIPPFPGCRLTPLLRACPDFPQATNSRSGL
ncbi:hypothetical protein GL4_3263 [Methyloceanibacter caenitepidi]|uniref:Uncharacterized protein n=1 Tax=Methyloceanibacter caenitepidi TaxID=1384459 RepID=A0A0A8K6W5_9HYPH|nr:hypothetical protein GL4_3263 [Methyloceanibacter caenitepidi]